MYKIFYSKTAAKDIAKLKAAQLDVRVKRLIDLIKENPYQNPPSYERLIGDIQGLYSRRINIQHQLVYEVLEDQKSIVIVSLWTHYER